jgi:hypothetical protein
VKVRIIKVEPWQVKPLWNVKVGEIADAEQDGASLLIFNRANNERNVYTSPQNAIDLKLEDTPLYKAMNEN